MSAGASCQNPCSSSWSVTRGQSRRLHDSSVSRRAVREAAREKVIAASREAAVPVRQQGPLSAAASLHPTAAPTPCIRRACIRELRSERWAVRHLEDVTLANPATRLSGAESSYF